MFDILLIRGEGRQRGSCKAGIIVRWDKVDSARDLGGLSPIFRQGVQRRKKINIKKRPKKRKLGGCDHSKENKTKDETKHCQRHYGPRR